jgi:glucose uptake protein GlcU
MDKATSILKYLVDPVPGTHFSYYMPLMVIALVLIAGGVAFSLLYNRKKKEDFAFKRLFKKTGSRMVLLGLLFLFLVAVRYEMIIYFSMRIFLYLSILLLLYFLYRQMKKIFVQYPKEKTNMITNMKFNTSQKEVNKYLPNKNKR